MLVQLERKRMLSCATISASQAIRELDPSAGKTAQRTTNISLGHFVENQSRMDGAGEIGDRVTAKTRMEVRANARSGDCCGIRNAKTATTPSRAAFAQQNVQTG